MCIRSVKCRTGSQNDFNSINIFLADTGICDRTSRDFTMQLSHRKVGRLAGRMFVNARDIRFPLDTH